MLRPLPVLVMVAGLLASAAQAATVLAYDTVNATAVASAPSGIDGLVAADLRPGAGISPRRESHFAVDGFSTAGSLTEARATDDAILFGFDSTTNVRLGTLNFFVTRDNNGPSSVALDVALDSALAQLIVAEFDPGKAGTFISVDLSALGSAKSVAFRLLGWNARRTNGKLEIVPQGADGTFGLVLGGTEQMAAIPVPAGVLLLASALVAVRVVRHRARPA